MPNPLSSSSQIPHILVPTVTPTMSPEPQNLTPKTSVPNPEAFKPRTTAPTSTLPQQQEINTMNQQIDTTPSQQIVETAENLPKPTTLESIAPPPPQTHPQTHPLQTPDKPVPPPRLTDTQLQESFSQELFSKGQINTLNTLSRDMPNMVKEVDGINKGVQIVEKTLDDALKALDKRKKAYNSPLYRLGDAIGFKDRQFKLEQLSAAREKLIQNSQSLLSSHQLTQEIGNDTLAHASSQLREQIQQAHSDGVNFVQNNLQNKGLIWRLGLQSEKQLQESLTPAFLSKMPNSEELLTTYSHLQNDYAKKKSDFEEVHAFSKQLDQMVTDFVAANRDLKTSKPKEYAVVRDALLKEMSQLSQPYLAMAKNLGIPEAIRVDDAGNARISDTFANAFQELPDAPPKLFDVLPQEHQAFIKSMAQGMLSAMPNRVLDDSSIEIGGQKYINKTKLGEATMAIVYSYEHPDNPQQKIVVKVPKSEGLSEDQFQAKILDESVRELENHYQAMGNTGQGNPHMVSLIGAVSTPNGPLIAMELVDKKDCSSLFKQMESDLKTQNLSPDEHRILSKHVVYQMMQGLDYMHSKDMTHLDVKIDNFLVHSDGTVKVADFGMSKSQAQFSARRSELGDNFAATPPEAFFDGTVNFASGTEIANLSNKFDAWSMGNLMHLVFLDKPQPLVAAFGIDTTKNVIQFAKDPNNRIFPNPGSPVEDLINHLMHPDPQQRFSMKQAMEHPFFAELFASPGQIKPEVQALMQKQLGT